MEALYTLNSSPVVVSFNELQILKPFIPLNTAPLRRLRGLVAEGLHFIATSWEKMTPYRTESLHFLFCAPELNI